MASDRGLVEDRSIYDDRRAARKSTHKSLKRTGLRPSALRAKRIRDEPGLDTSAPRGARCSMN
jgi:hypothetical protein